MITVEKCFSIYLFILLSALVIFVIFYFASIILGAFNEARVTDRLEDYFVKVFSKKKACGERTSKFTYSMGNHGKSVCEYCRTIEEWDSNLHPNYCPNCGAKVIVGGK